MQFVIADSFTESLCRLTAEEQKLAKLTAFDLQTNPSSPGLRFHRIEQSKDKNFWSVRVGSDVRLIVHKTNDSVMVCYVDHHDKAYSWAERRKIEVHPTTGATQLVEVRERVEEIIIKKVVVKSPMFGKYSQERLMEYGVPPEWLGAVLDVETEDELFDVIGHLPRECGEALLSLAVGEAPSLPVKSSGIDPLEHPDARRRFRVVGTTEELEAALSYPWERWSVFLHPSQRELVEREYSGPARVLGAAGTGKTVVALHRAAALARRGARVLLTTFSEALAGQLRRKLWVLLGEEREGWGRVEVGSLGVVSERLYGERFGAAEVASKTTIQRLLGAVSGGVSGHKFKLPFLYSEWQEVIDAWQIDSLEAYQDLVRVGRRAKVNASQREILWKIFAELKKCLVEAGLTTQAEKMKRLGDVLKASGEVVFDAVVVDEAQDVSVSQLRLLAALGAGRANGLFFAGDAGQRIFQQPFSWKELGVEVKGRSSTLRVNYRTSSQIMRQAERLMASGMREDAEWGGEERRPISVVSGPEPVVLEVETQEEEASCVSSWLGERFAEGVSLGEVGVFVRSATELDRAQAALRLGGWSYRVLDEEPNGGEGEQITLCTMHLAKGLEFRVVVVMACDEDIIPLQARVELAGDVGSSEDVYETERHLLYVACTRARDRLMVTSVSPASEFLVDLKQSPKPRG
jgi:hypothetical protein